MWAAPAGRSVPDNPSQSTWPSQHTFKQDMSWGQGAAQQQQQLQGWLASSTAQEQRHAGTQETTDIVRGHGQSEGKAAGWVAAGNQAGTGIKPGVASTGAGGSLIMGGGGGLWGDFMEGGGDVCDGDEECGGEDDRRFVTAL